MSQRRVQAMVIGLVAGGIAIAAALLALQTSVLLADLEDLVLWGLGVIVAPVAAGASALAMQATLGRAFTIAGLALLLAYALANLVDTGLTVMLLTPGAPGPYQGKPELTAEEVARIAETWLLGRHIALCALGVIGGAALGAWRGPRRSP